MTNGCRRSSLEKGNALLKAPGFQRALSVAVEGVFPPVIFCARSH